MSNEQNHNEDEKLISKKAIFHKYCDVHVKLKNGWENGYIEEVSADHLILKLSPEGSLKHGIDKMPIFFLEIKDISEYNRRAV